MVRQTNVGIKHFIGSSSLMFFLSMTLTTLLFLCPPEVALLRTSFSFSLLFLGAASKLGF